VRKPEADNGPETAATVTCYRDANPSRADAINSTQYSVVIQGL
jgi:hypothetical protein